MKKVIASALAATILSSAVYADTMSLYRDPKTGQVFTTAGEGRVEMGAFTDAKSVDMQLKDIEKKEAAYEDKIDKYVSQERIAGSNKLKMRGYMQFRMTDWYSGQGQDINTGREGTQPFTGYWADRSTSPDQNFLIRRARLIFFGDVADHLGVYIQPDFASTAGTTGNVAQLRDFYGDVYIDKTKEHRVRFGLSKVPYGFENMQSSSNRLTLDRNDAFNSGTRDERDTGATYYYTPVAIQELFNEIAKLELKHSGNYGMFALGAYNGQGANQAERNDNHHIVTRFTYPFKTASGQIYEVGIQGYTGSYVSPNITAATPFTVSPGATAGTLVNVPATTGARMSNTQGVKDQRIGISAIMYQQSFGLQTEWNWGTTPGADTSSGNTIISEKKMTGGYVQPMYRFTDVIKDKDVLTAFVKWQYFDGYSKAELNSPLNQVNDWEVGAEWQMAKEFELTAVLHKMNRTDLGQLNGYGERFKGTAMRIQAQMNF